MIGFLLGICALIVALFYLISKRNFRPILNKNTPFLKRKFLTAVAILVAFFSSGKILAAVGEAESPMSSTSIKEKQKLEDIEKTSQWKELKKRWLNLKKSEGWSITDIQKEVEKQKKINNKYLGSLVASGYFSQNVSYILNYIYGQLLFHRLRSTVGWTCYKMAPLGSVMSGTRRNLEDRLKLLSEISDKEIVNKNVLKEAKSDIERNIEFLSRAQGILDKEEAYDAADETHWEERRALVDLFKDGKVDSSVEAEKDVSIAAELIVRLNAGSDNFLEEERQTKIKQLKNFKEWGQIKSIWKNVSKIEGFGFDEMEKTITKKKEENWVLLSKLLGAGLFTKEGAKVFNDIYGDRVFHRLRPMAATCYEPTIIGMRQQQVRDNIENRLKVLEEISKQDTLKDEVLKQAEKNLQKDMEVVLLVNEWWEKTKRDGWDKYDNEEKEILSYFTDEDYSNTDIDDNIKIREGVGEAMEIIQLIYSD